MTYKAWWIATITAFRVTMLSLPTHAATVTSEGVTYLHVGAEFYDVAFVEGSCVSFFEGCNDVEDIAFPGSENLSEAMTVLAGVLNAGYSFPSFFPTGCSVDVGPCLILTPSSLSLIGSVFIPDTRVVWDDFNDRWRYGQGGFIPSLEYTYVSFAVWSLSEPIAPVPLPATGLLMVGGLAGLWTLRRRNRADVR